MKKNILIVLLACFSLLPQIVLAEYALSPVLEGGSAVMNHFERNESPHLRTNSKCDARGITCFSQLINHNGEILLEYNASKYLMHASQLTRYQSKAFMIISIRKLEKNKVLETFIIDSDGSKTKFDSMFGGISFWQKIITLRGELLAVSEIGIHTSSQILEAPEKLVSAKFRNNLAGDIALIAVGESGGIYVSDTKKWLNTGIMLSENGDRLDVISVYVDPQSQLIYSAVYKYINLYNKGIIVSSSNMNDGTSKFGWLFNSEDRNIGFSPKIYSTANDVVVSAENSSNRSTVHFSIDKSLFPDLYEFIPDHALGYENESMISFLAGMGVASQQWIAKSSIPENDAISLEVDYKLDATLYQSVYMQGKYKGTQLAVSYLENQFRELGKTEERVSRALSFFVDFNGLFSKQSTLRIKSESAKVYGTAFIKGQENSEREFVTRFQSYSTLLMFEKGLYSGLEYTEYKMPSALGFSDQNFNVVDAQYDPATGINRLSFVIGYDEPSYAARYETNYVNYYTSGELNLGLAYINISKDIKDKVEATGKSINTPVAFAAGLKAEVGIVGQRRLKILRGAGLSFFAGYRVNALFFGARQDEDAEDPEIIDANELALEYERYDVWHGPFANVNVVF